MFKLIGNFFRNINKKVLVSSIFVLVIFLSGLGYIIVNNILNAFDPVAMNLTTGQRAIVSGNGGNAVIVGDYVYFTGNYINTADIKYKQNEYNKVEFGAIYRVKLTDGAPTYSDSSETHNTQLEDYIYHHVKNKQLIVPKVAGFENSALYVFDKYLIYTSPNNNKDKYGALQSDKIDFYRVDLDGDNHRHIYTTSSNYVALGDFTVACYGSSKDIYLLIKDGDNLRRVNVTGSVGKVDTISKKATSWALPVVSAYSNAGSGAKSLSASYSGVMNFVYYTESLSDKDVNEVKQTGNVLKQYWVSKGESKQLAKEHNTEFTVDALSNSRLLYRVIDTDDKNSGLVNAPVYMTKGNGDADSTVPFAASSREDYKVDLDGTEEVLSEEVLQMSSELNTVNTDTVFIGKASNSVFVYRVEVGSNRASLFNTFSDVDSIIAITPSTIYYRNSSTGEIMMGDLYKDEAAVGTGLTPTSLTRITFFSKSGIGERMFYIKQFEDEASTNCAMMIDIGKNKEYVLGSLADKYLPENLKEKD